MTDKIATYGQFWPYYLREHSRRACRAMHYAGTTLAIASIVLLIITGNAWYLLGTVVGGYGFAWAAHYFVEHNRPATFTYPAWSLYSDFRMYVFAVTGRLAAELAKAGQPEPDAGTAPPQSV